MKPYSFMTEKQGKTINWICYVLGIEYTGSPSSVDACKFINEHYAEAFKKDKRR